jgi:hypothetical protein
MKFKKFKTDFSKIANFFPLTAGNFEALRRQTEILRKREEFRALTGSYDFFIEAHKRSIYIAESLGYESHKITMMVLEFVSYCLKIGLEEAKILFYLQVYKNNYTLIQTSVDILKYIEKTYSNDHELMIKTIEAVNKKKGLERECCET